MKLYIKVFLVSLVAFALIFLGLWKFVIEGAEIDDSKTAMPQLGDHTTPGEDGDDISISLGENETPGDTAKSEFETLVEASDRVNFVVFGHDGGRADTIMFVSFDPGNQLVDIINIPRDTYWTVEGYTERADHKKINAVYGFGSGNGGASGLKQQIANMLQVPVHYYVKFDYKGAAAVVDTLGGIEVNVPFDMDYDDPYASPPLHIKIDAGLQTLDGENAVDYLRWRKNNDDVASGGDLPRIKRMQDFIKLTIKRSMSLKLPSVVNTAMNYIESDIAVNLAISYAADAVGMPSGNISTHTLPGEAPARSSYYIGDPADIHELVKDIYSKGQ